MDKKINVKLSNDFFLINVFFIDEKDYEIIRDNIKVHTVKKMVKNAPEAAEQQC